jgi:hypothetical protein
VKRIEVYKLALKMLEEVTFEQDSEAQARQFRSINERMIRDGVLAALGSFRSVSSDTIARICGAFGRGCESWSLEAWSPARSSLILLSI